MKHCSLIAVAFVFIFWGCSTKKNVVSKLSYNDELVSHRAKYIEGFALDERAPLKHENATDSLDFFDIDPRFRLHCKCELISEKSVSIIPTYSGNKKEYIPFAKANCTKGGMPIVLTLFRPVALMSHPIYKNLLFCPFKDNTTGQTTYGGGRYLDLKIDDILDGFITIDFNKAYNPWCAFSDGYNCPVPPKENTINIDITAGERQYKGTVLHD